MTSISIGQTSLQAPHRVHFSPEGPFRITSDQGGDLHDQSNRAENQAKRPLLLKNEGKRDSRREIEGITYDKPSELSPLAKALSI